MKTYVAHGRETLRDYLDVEIGRVVLGRPLRTLQESGARLGVTKDAVFHTERRILRKIGRAVRELEE